MMIVGKQDDIDEWFIISFLNNNTNCLYVNEDVLFIIIIYGIQRCYKIFYYNVMKLILIEVELLHLQDWALLMIYHILKNV